MAASNGKLIVVAMLGIVGVWVAAGLLWTDGPMTADERAALPIPPLPEDAADKPLRITDRQADGSVVVSNVPEGQESRVEASRKRRAAEAAAKEAAGESNPFQAFVDDGQPLTGAAMKDQDMRSLAGSEESYDPATEARQRFHELEMDLLAEVPLTPESWRSVTAAHQDDMKAVFHRAKALTDAGEADAARLLLEEWGELQQKYQAQAYGRAPQPAGVKEP